MRRKGSGGITPVVGRKAAMSLNGRMSRRSRRLLFWQRFSNLDNIDPPLFDGLQFSLKRQCPLLPVVDSPGEFIQLTVELLPRDPVGGPGMLSVFSHGDTPHNASLERSQSHL